MGKVIVVFILDKFLSALLMLESKLIVAAYISILFLIFKGRLFCRLQCVLYFSYELNFFARVLCILLRLFSVYQSTNLRNIPVSVTGTFCLKETVSQDF
jgi:hypothetical protein